MSFYLRTMRLVNIGNTDARFADHTLRFTDADDQPADTLGWLANGGGKSSLESLLFAHLLPRASDFMQHKDGRALTDYVLDGDTGHVICEWSIADPDQMLPRTFVTGAVYEWEQRRRSPSGDRDKFFERWYSFEPQDRALTLETLPVKDGTTLLLAKDYLERLRNQGIAHPALRMSANHQSQKDWKKTLDANGIDTELLRYQKDMNHTEGGIEQLFNFKTHEAFIDFLLDVVVNPDQPDRVAGNLASMAKTLRRKPEHRLERDFCLQVGENLRPIAGAFSKARDAGDALDSTISEATELYARFSARAAHDRRIAKTCGDAAESASQLRAQKDRESKAANNRARELNRIAAKFAVTDAKEDVEAAKRDCEAAEVLRDAWRLTVPLYRAQIAEASAADLTAEIERETNDLQPLRTDHDQAARHLRAALAAEKERLNGELEAATEAAEAAETEAAEHSERSIGHANRVVELAGVIAKYDGLIERFERDLASARAHGALGPDENVEAAEARLAAAQQAAEERLADLDAAVEKRGKAVADLQASKHEHELSAAALDSNAETMEQTVEQVQRRAKAIIESPRTSELLETDEIDLWRDADLILQQLRRAIVSARQRMIALAVESAEDRRALESLESSEFLPSTLEAERLCDYLRRKGIEAHTSWSWLQRSLNPTERAERVKTAPAWVSGIVVADAATRARAIAVLETSGEGGAGFTAIATIPELQHGSYLDPTDAPLINAPLHAALYNVGAARAESERRTRAKTGRDETAEALSEQERNDTGLERRIVELLGEYRAEWIPEQQQAIRSKRDRAAALRGQAKSADDQLEELAKQDRSDREERAEIQSEGLIRAGHVREIRALVNQVAPAAEAAAQQSLCEAEQQEEQTARDLAARKAEGARQAAGQERQRAALLKKEAEARAEEILEVQLFDERPDDADPTPKRHDAGLAALKKRVELLRRRYSKETADSQLAHKLEETQAQRTAALTDFNRGSDNARTLATDLLEAHPEEDESRLYEHGVAAEGEYTAAASRVGETAQVLKAAEDRLRDETPKGRTRYITLDIEPDDETEARARAIEEQSAATLLSNAVTELDKKQADLLREQEALNSNAKLLANHAKALQEQLPAEIGQPEAGGEPPFEGDETAADTARSRMITALQEVTRGRASALGTFRTKVRALRDLVQEPRYAAIEQRLRDRFVDDSDEAIGASASERAEQLELRAQQVDGMLAEVVKHQAVVVGQICEIVTASLADLRRAQRFSALPSTMTGPWAGEPFLRIRFESPGGEEELQRRVVELVDELVGLPVSVPGMELVKRAVRAAARQFNVKVLKPNVAQRVEPCQATALGKLSGGEKLTVNIMLYCTLAKLRAANRGGKPSGGVLVLDNPIGHASRADLIDLQRQVARAHEVQLFYVTGIEDPGAIRQFPNLIRMRNLASSVKERQYVTIENRGGEPRAEHLVSNVRVAGPDRGLNVGEE